MLGRVPVIVMPSGLNGLATVRSLGRRGFPVLAGGVEGDPTSISAASHYVRQAFVYPDPTVSESEFISFLLGRASDWVGAILLPTSDTLAEVLSRHKPQLKAAKYRVPVPEGDALAVFLDKPKTYALAEKLGIPCPRTRHFVPGQSRDLELDSFALPCLVKPVRSLDFARYDIVKAKVVRELRDLKAFLATLETDAVEAMVQELIPGPDSAFHEYVAYWDVEHRPVAEFTYRKIRQNPPRLGVGRVGLSTRNKAIIGPARRILEAGHFVGLTEVEFKYDQRDAKYKLIEVNPRSTMQMQLPIDCGVDLPWVLYRDVVFGQEVPVSDWARGVYWIHAVGELRSLSKYCHLEHSTLSDYLRPYLGPHSWPVFALDDLGPWFADLKRVACKIWMPCISRLMGGWKNYG